MSGSQVLSEVMGAAPCLYRRRVSAAGLVKSAIHRNLESTQWYRFCDELWAAHGMQESP